MLICVNILTKSITLLLFKMKKLIIFILFYNLDRYCKKTQYIFYSIILLLLSLFIYYFLPFPCYFLFMITRLICHKLRIN